MNCFVHCPIDLNIKNLDSINGIYDMIKAQAITLKSEGGYGCVGNNSKVLKIKSVTVNKKIYYLNNEKDLKFLKKNNII